jgi:hypothetical protein
MIFINLFNHSGCTRLLTEMNTKNIEIMFGGVKRQQARKAVKFTSICEPTV